MTIDRLSHLQAEIGGYCEQLAGQESAHGKIEDSQKERVSQLLAQAMSKEIAIE
jgi:hypothetical protein